MFVARSTLSGTFTPSITASPGSMSTSFTFSVDFRMLSRSLLGFSEDYSCSLVLLFTFMDESLVSTFIRSARSRVLGARSFGVSTVISSTARRGILLAYI